MRLPFAIIISLALMSLFVDFYTWLDIRQTKSKKRWVWCDRYALMSVFLWLFLAVALFLPRRGLNGGVYIVMWMLTVYLSIYIPKLVYCLFSLMGRIPRLFKRKRWCWTKYLGIALAAVCFVSVWGGIFYTRLHIQTIRVTLESDRLPEIFDGYRIVQISDLHLGTIGNNNKFVEALVDSVNAMKPDLVVFTGDMVNQKSEEMLPFIETLSGIKATDGIYSILGNHDYGDYVDWPSAKAKTDNLDSLKSYQTQSGFRMLNNESKVILRTAIAPNDSIEKTDSIFLIGVENWGEPPFVKYGDLTKAYPGNLNDTRFKILLTHNPAHWTEEVRKISNIDLSLAGHTHAMQVCVNAMGKRWSPSACRYPTWGGFYSDGENGRIEDYGQPSTDNLSRRLSKPSLYVNIGAGEVAIPIRLISAYPEITLITLKSK